MKHQSQAPATRGLSVTSHLAGSAERICSARARGYSWLAEHCGDPGYAERYRSESESWALLGLLAEVDRRYP